MEAQLLDQFRPVKNSFILHNAKPEKAFVGWGGTQWWLPARDEIGAKPGRDAEGNPIPGTTVVEDIVITDMAGELVGEPGESAAVSAKQVVEHALGFNAKTGTAQSSYALSGISLLPNKASTEQIARVIAEGTRRWEEFDLQSARQIVSAEEQKVAAHQKAGMSSPPPSRAYEVAVQKLNAARDRMRKTFNEHLDGAASPEPAVFAEDELDLIVFAKAMLAKKFAEQEASRDLAPSKQAELVVESLKDPRIMQLVRKQYRIRKIGYGEITPEKLEKQVAEIEKAEAAVLENAQPLDLGE
jgi:hypothetical protein